jgi:hypothetical protein
MTGSRDLLYSTTATSGTNIFSFDDIPSTYNHLQLYLMGSQSTGSQDILCTLNHTNATSFSYDYTLWYQNNGDSCNTISVSGATCWLIGPLPSQAVGTNTPGFIMMDFLFYTVGAWNRIVKIDNGYINQSNTDSRLTHGDFSNRSQSSISSIQLMTANGVSFGSGTIVNLYGIV